MGDGAAIRGGPTAGSLLSMDCDTSADPAFVRPRSVGMGVDDEGGTVSVARLRLARVNVRRLPVQARDSARASACSCLRRRVRDIRVPLHFFSLQKQGTRPDSDSMVQLES